MKKANILTEPLVKWILVFAVIIFAVVFLLPKTLEGADKVLSFIGVSSSKCPFVSSKCTNCLSIVSSDPQAIQFRSADDWSKSSCEFASSKLVLTFSENLKSQDISIWYACGKTPNTKEDWSMYSDQKATYDLIQRIQVTMQKNTVQILGLDSNCNYRLAFGKNLLSESNKNINSDQQVIVFKIK